MKKQSLKKSVGDLDSNRPKNGRALLPSTHHAPTQGGKVPASKLSVPVQPELPISEIEGVLPRRRDRGGLDLFPLRGGAAQRSRGRRRRWLPGYYSFGEMPSFFPRGCGWKSGKRRATRPSSRCPSYCSMLRSCSYSLYHSGISRVSFGSKRWSNVR